MKQTLLIIAVAVLALTGGVWARQHLNGPENQVEAKAIATFDFPDLEGNRHTLSDWSGKVIIVNFWATWCPPCRKEIPEFAALQQEYGDQGLQFIGIAIEDKEPVEEFIDFIEINYPILIGGDPAIELAQQLGNTLGAVPFSVVIDLQGQIVHRQAGEFSKDKVIKLIEPLLK